MSVSVADFRGIEALQREKRTVLYRAYRRSGEEPILIKTFVADYPTPKDIMQLKREYEIAVRAAGPGVLAPIAWVPYRQTWLLKFEDCGGETLEQRLQEGPLELELFLEVAIRITDTLLQLHRKNIIHKDIKPGNILFNPASGEVKIANFSNATLLSGERSEMVRPDELEGSLPYMSPEQTGRLNRPTDIRSDLYSLGVTFYELLTGHLPFVSDDPVKLLHQHLTVEAASPSSLRTHIPQPVSDIVMKCLGKNAEDRYQSAYGVLHDLELCLYRLKTDGAVHPFVIGQEDRPEHFRVSDVLYGREEETKQLVLAFERTQRGGAEAVFVSGASGVGKSSLVQELKRTVLQKRGFFIAGTYDQQQQGMHQGVLEALNQLLHQFLAESDEVVALWRDKILQAVGPSVQVLIEVLPALELITGQQPQVAPLPTLEAQTRFRLALQNLFGVFATEEHPLVLVLDDLQWADHASLNLLDDLMGDRSTAYLLLIGCYREKVTSSSDKLLAVIHSLRGKDVLREIRLGPLDVAFLRQMMADTLRCSPEATEELAEIVCKKDGGNPFFAKQFLQTLHDRGLLVLEAETGEWHWDIDRIRQMEIGEGQLDFLLDKIRLLPESTQELLRTAACIGTSFELETLHHVLGRDLPGVATDLLRALEEGILLTKGTAYKSMYGLHEDVEEEEWLRQFRISVQFLHERVQRAAYRLLDEAERVRLHLKIGRWLSRDDRDSDREGRLFERVNHLNEALDLIVDPEERERTAHLNLEAGKRAKVSTAYEQALRYVSVGTSLLETDSWETQYALTFDLHKELFELAYLCRQMEQAEGLFDLLLTKAKTLLEKSSVYMLMIQLCFFEDRMEKALETGVEALRTLGIELKDLHMSKASRRRAYLKLKARLQESDHNELIQAPMAQDPFVIAQIETMNNIGIPAFHLVPNLYYALRIRMVESALEHGLTEHIGMAFIGVGAMVMTEFQDYETADELCRLGVAMEQAVAAGNGTTSYRGAIFYANTVQPWTTDQRAVAASLFEAAQTALEFGDLKRAVYCMTDWAKRMVYGGAPLEDLRQELHKQMRTFRRGQSDWILYLVYMYLGLISHLQGKNGGTTDLSGEHFDESFYRNHVLPQQSWVFKQPYYYGKILVHYLAGEYADVLAMMPLVDQEVQLNQSDFTFLFALAIAGQVSNVPVEEQPELLKQLNGYRRQMKRWARLCPVNFDHCVWLLEAEAARLSGRERKAMDLYDRAVETANRSGCLHHAAMANECAARFYLKMGKPHLADPYLMAAHYGYLRWGAVAKAERMEAQHPSLLLSKEKEGGAGNIDFLSVMKAARTISGEIVLEKLLEKLIEIVLENAGAQKVLFLMQQEDGLHVVARKHPDRPGLVFESTPWQACGDLSPMVIQYVNRLHEALVLHDAARDDVFAKDPYIWENKPKSILCLPILNQGRMLGIMYAENNLMTNGFTADRLEVMNLLSSQVAVSVENASLYQRQVRLNEAYGRFVPHQFLRLLQKKSIVDVELGDHRQLDMTVMFADIRSFTTMSERMTPEGNFYFLNNFLSRMEPMIQENGGFIDKYIGDSIMALFEKEADDAVCAAIAMLRELHQINEQWSDEGHEAIRIGIGINSGRLMLGTIGGFERMDSTVISDAVNLAARIEELTKMYRVPLLISDYTRAELRHPGQYRMRPVDRVAVRGRSVSVTLYEVFEADPEKDREAKLHMNPLYEKGYESYWAGDWKQALECFEACLLLHPNDEVVGMYVERCLQNMDR